MLLEQNQADRAINLHPTKAFYQHLLGRYSLEDARGGETPILELDRTAPRWTSTNLDAQRSKLYKETVGELAWLSMLRPDIAFAVHRCSLSLSKPTEEHEDQLRSLLKYIAGTQTYTISLQIPRRWERATNLELLAFSTSWVQSSKAATCVSLSFMGVHLGASIQQATSKSQAELLSVRLASILAFHTKSLLQDLQLAKPLCFRVLTRGPVPFKLGLSQRTRHIELSSHLGQFRLSKVRPQQNLAELLANNLRACELHRLLPKLQLRARCLRELALPTLQCEGKAFSSSSLGSFYIGQLRCAPAMEKPQLVQKLSGKEFVDHLANPELDSTKLIQQQLSSGGANTALHNELSATSLQPESSLTEDKLEQLALRISFQELSLQQHSLQAAYSIGIFQTPSLTGTSLSFQIPALTLTSLNQIELERFQTFKPKSSTRASVDQLTAWSGLTKALEKKPFASTSALCASRKQVPASKLRIFPNLVRELVILMVICLILCSLSLSSCMSTLILHSLSFLSTSSSLTCISLSFQSGILNCWAHELSEQHELLTTFGSDQLISNELSRAEGGEELVETLAITNLLWDQETEELLATKSCQLDQPQQQQQDQLEKQLWSIQLQQNLFENELDINKNKKNKNEKKLENKEFDKKNFQSLIYKKLVALLQKKHFASAASSQLLGYEAWGKYREASEDSFDKVGDKELLQEQLRRQELGYKDLWPAYLWALCPDSFEDTSFTEKTFANTSLDKESFTDTSLDKESFTDSSLTKSSFTESSLAENTFSKKSFAKKSFAKKSFAQKSFAQKSFDKKGFSKKSFAKKSFAQKSFAQKSFDKKGFSQKSFHKKSFAKTSFAMETFDKQSFDKKSFNKSSFDKSSFGTSSLEESSLAQSSLANSSLAESSLKDTSFEESSFKKSSFNQSTFEDSSFSTGSLEESSFTSSFEQSSLKLNSFETRFGDSSFRRHSFQNRSFTPDSFQTSHFQDRSLTEDSFQLYQLERRTSTSELAKLAKQDLTQPELSPAWKTELKALRAQPLRKGSFSFLSGSSHKTGWARGGVLSRKLPLSLLDLDKLEPDLCVLAQAELASASQKRKLPPKLSRHEKKITQTQTFESGYFPAG